MPWAGIQRWRRFPSIRPFSSGRRSCLDEGGGIHAQSRRMFDTSSGVDLLSLLKDGWMDGMLLLSPASHCDCLDRQVHRGDEEARQHPWDRIVRIDNTHRRTQSLPKAVSARALLHGCGCAPASRSTCSFIPCWLCAPSPALTTKIMSTRKEEPRPIPSRQNILRRAGNKQLCQSPSLRADAQTTPIMQL